MRNRTIHGLTHELLDFQMPDFACDCHTHVFGPAEQFLFSPNRQYTPGNASVTDLLELHQILGIQRVVIVHPSPYGSDNSCTLDALQKIGSNARGIAVIDHDIGRSQLQEMHEMGIRGIRLNLETSGIQDPEFAKHELFKAAEQVQELGWHIQLYTNLKLLAALKGVIQQVSAPIVVDHFCRAQAELGVDQPDLGDLLELVQNGRVWVKLSAPHRIAVDPDSLETKAIGQLFVNTNPDQMLWGSDWPHPGGRRGQENARSEIESFNPIDDGHALNRFAKWLDDPLLLEKILVSNPAKLYDF